MKKLDYPGEPNAGMQNLMKMRVREILLVSSLYDSFMLAQDGQLNEVLLSEFVGLNMYQAPIITRTGDGKRALKLVKENPRIDLVITTMQMRDVGAKRLVNRIKKMRPDLPLIMLANETTEIHSLIKNGETELFDKIFLWQGDFRILLGIVKFIEDRWNVKADTEEVGVQSIILVEDNVKFYSSFLPLIYAEVMNHSLSLMRDGLNMADKLIRMRARPKILLCETYEEAWDYYKRYKKYVLGIITDIEFPRKGKKDPQAGAYFAKQVKAKSPDIPVLLQSFQPDVAEIAEAVGASFSRKDSPRLLDKLRRFMFDHLGFGSFVFRLPNSDSEVGSAGDLREFECQIADVPEESILFHGERNHFSTWLKTRTEFALAAELRPRKVEDYPSLEELRQDIIARLRKARHARNLHLIADFSPDKFDPESSFAHIGGGSMGGKARGLAFINHFINFYSIRDRFSDIQIFIPPAVVLCTDVFDHFMELNRLSEFAANADDDNEIVDRFLTAEFPSEYYSDLIATIRLMEYPLAVRSSSLLEDSRYQPFSGVYNTYMLPNNHPEPDVRLNELLIAIKRVYASIYLKNSKQYMKATPYLLEEEKMGVIIQKLTGCKHENRFYPDLSGVVRSHKFYSSKPMEPEDGIASVALGLGETVVAGGKTVKFCPSYPKHPIQYTSPRDFLEHTQSQFYALDLNNPICMSDMGKQYELPQFGLDAAEKDETLFNVGSTYSTENETIYDGLSRPGIRMVSFAPILKMDVFPLPEILEVMTFLGRKVMAGDVEIEFAANLSVPRGQPKEFSVLQMKPMVQHWDESSLEFDDIDKSEIICETDKILGVGVINNIHDIVTVDYVKFERSNTVEIAREIELFNARLLSEERPYLLIGFGRWGSADHWLGIPVTWDKISGAKVIVETGFKDMKVTPSQGAHFFHNLMSFKIGYFTVNPDHGEGFIDWDWLSSQPVHRKGEYVRQLRFEYPIDIKMNSHKNRGVIIKPDRMK